MLCSHHIYDAICGDIHGMGFFASSTVLVWIRGRLARLWRVHLQRQRLPAVQSQGLPAPPFRGCPRNRRISVMAAWHRVAPIPEDVPQFVHASAFIAKVAVGISISVDVP